MPVLYGWSAVSGRRLVRTLQVSRVLNVIFLLMVVLQLGSGEREKELAVRGIDPVSLCTHSVHLHACKPVLQT